MSSVAALRGSVVKPRLLLVDDERGVLETTTALVSDDYDVVSCYSPIEALEKLGKADFDVVCSDYSMPGMTGIEFLRASAERWPLVAAVLVTGFSEMVAEKRRPTDSFLLVVKPYEPPRLLDTLERAARLAKVRRGMHEMMSGLKLKK
jgi:CheY-like chemotaxis protein